MQNFINAVISSDLFRLSIFTLGSLKSLNLGAAIGAYIGSLLYVAFAVSIIKNFCNKHFSRNTARTITIISAIALVIWPGGVTCILAACFAVYILIMFISGIGSAVANGSHVTQDGISSRESDFLKYGSVIDKESPFVKVERNCANEVTGVYIHGEYHEANYAGFNRYSIGEWVYDDND